MKSFESIISTCLVSLSLVLASAPVPARDFVDPLDGPAQMSSLAQSTLLIATARAGDRLVAAGWRGHILYSDDQGETWTQTPVPVSVTLTALSFPTAQQGWAVGHSGVVLHTEDGGETWERLLDGRQTPKDTLAFYDELAASGDELAAQWRKALPINWEHGAEQPWLDVWFENEQHGFVVGPFNLIYETQDGGQSWTPWMHRVDNAKALHLNAIEVVGEALYMPSELGLVHRMRSGEESFSRLETGYTGSFFGVCGDASLVLAYGLRGTVYASLDQGDSWAPVETGEHTALTACTRSEDGGYLIAASSGQVVEIERNGKSVSAAVKASALWPLTGLSTMGDRLVGVGMGGIWLPDNRSQ